MTPFKAFAALLGLFVVGLLFMGTAGTVTWHSSSGFAIESDADAGTTGVLSVTFKTPFTNVPACTCSTVGAIACFISAAPTVAAVQFTATAGGSDVIDYTCVGNK